MSLQSGPPPKPTGTKADELRAIENHYWKTQKGLTLAPANNMDEARDLLNTFQGYVGALAEIDTKELDVVLAKAVRDVKPFMESFYAAITAFLSKTNLEEAPSNSDGVGKSPSSAGEGENYVVGAGSLKNRKPNLSAVNSASTPSTRLKEEQGSSSETRAIGFCAMCGKRQSFFILPTGDRECETCGAVINCSSEEVPQIGLEEVRAIISSRKLLALAAYLDKTDKQLGNTGIEIQSDLRKLAAVMALLEKKS